jgi:flagellin
MIINHNLSAINTHMVLKFQNWNVDKAIEKLSSGMRINRAGDDASGLSVSEKMSTQMRVLAIQSSHGIYTQSDRQLIQVEVSALVNEVDRIASQAEFNKMKLLLGDFARINPRASMWFHIGPNMHHREVIPELLH